MAWEEWWLRCARSEAEEQDATDAAEPWRRRGRRRAAAGRRDGAPASGSRERWRRLQTARRSNGRGREGEISIKEVCDGYAHTPREASALFNQLLVIPIIYYPLFYAITGPMQGLTKDESIERARSQFVPITIRNWKFWIPANFAQFVLLPLKVRSDPFK